MLTLRDMRASDLRLVAGWLEEPHVARWWLADTTAEAEMEKLGRRVAAGADIPTRMLVILERSPAGHDGERDVEVPIGWCQWYPYDAYPEDAVAMGAHAGDCGIDYAIGNPAAVDRGLGTELIGALVAEVHRHRPGCGVIVDPDAENTGSRRVLEHNGFRLISVGPVATEPNENPTAIYRLDYETS